jgi:hypothetical protein
VLTRPHASSVYGRKLNADVCQDYNADALPSAEEVKASGMYKWELQSKKVVQALAAQNAPMLARFQKAEAEGKVIEKKKSLPLSEHVCACVAE